jgi:hypothetical protein
MHFDAEFYVAIGFALFLAVLFWGWRPFKVNELLSMRGLIVSSMN